MLLLVMLFLLPKSWMARVRGRRRVAAVPLAFLAVLLAQDMVIARFGAQPGTRIPGIGAGLLPLLGDGGAEAIAFYERAAAPFTTWTRMVLNVLAPASLIALLRLPFPSRVLPSISLRGVSLRRRFTLTYVLIRVLPQLIATAVLAMRTSRTWSSPTRLKLWLSARTPWISCAWIIAVSTSAIVRRVPRRPR